MIVVVNCVKVNMCNNFNTYINLYIFITILDHLNSDLGSMLILYLNEQNT